MKFPFGLNFLAIFLCGCIGIFIGPSSYTFYYAQGASYLSNDPKACANCHIMREQYDGWQKASHHAVATCNDCHIPHKFIPKYLTKLKNGFWHPKDFTLQDFDEPIRVLPKNRVILQKNCLYCHGELVSEIATHPGNDRKMLDCIHCHSSVAVVRESMTSTPRQPAGNAILCLLPMHVRPVITSAKQNSKAASN